MKYVNGKLVYIPALEERKKWGENSGYNRYLYDRNRKIFASDYNLSNPRNLVP